MSSKQSPDNNPPRTPPTPKALTWTPITPVRITPATSRQKSKSKSPLSKRPSPPAEEELAPKKSKPTPLPEDYEAVTCCDTVAKSNRRCKRKVKTLGGGPGLCGGHAKNAAAQERLRSLKNAWKVHAKSQSPRRPSSTAVGPLTTPTTPPRPTSPTTPTRALSTPTRAPSTPTRASTKTPSPRAPATTTTVTRRPSVAPEDQANTWVIPKDAPYGTLHFAHALFDGHPRDLHVLRNLRPAPVWSPVFLTMDASHGDGKLLRDYNGVGDVGTVPSGRIRDTYNFLSNYGTRRPNFWGRDLVEAFDDNAAVICAVPPGNGNTGDGPSLRSVRVIRVEVTNEEGEEFVQLQATNQRVDLTPPEDAELEPKSIQFVQYTTRGRRSVFLQLPEQTWVTINGQSFINDNSPLFFIGPLDSFAIIEYGLETIFYWRNRRTTAYVVPDEGVRDLSNDERLNAVKLFRRQAEWLGESIPTLELAESTIAYVEEELDDLDASDWTDLIDDGVPNLFDNKFDEFMNTLRDSGIQGREAQVSELNRFLEDSISLPDDMIDQDPCRYFSSRNRALRLFHNEYPPPWTAAQNARLTIPLVEYLQDEQVDLAVAAVVEAIDGMLTVDSEIGGLAIAASMDVTSAFCDEQSAQFLYSRASRGRRCWLMPFFISGEVQAAIQKGNSTEITELKHLPPGGHIVLVVLQEEEVSYDDGTDSTEFQISFLDSHPRSTRSLRDPLYRGIQRVARALGWSTHRNDPPTVDFSNEVRFVSVTRQKSGWECGLHTILNAWILALGLTPRLEDTEEWDLARSKGVFLDLRRLIYYAYAGILDWRTLVSWLLCKRLVRETSNALVLQERRFPQTRFQTTTEHLRDRVRDMFDLQQALEDDPEITTPYIHDSNVDFLSRMPESRVEAVRSSDDKDLKRRDSDIGDLFPLNFLNRY